MAERPQDDDKTGRNSGIGPSAAPATPAPTPAPSVTPVPSVTPAPTVSPAPTAKPSVSPSPSVSPAPAESGKTGAAGTGAAGSFRTPETRSPDPRPADGPARTAASTRTTPPRRSGKGGLIAFLVIALVLLIAWATLPAWVNALPAGLQPAARALMIDGGGTTEVADLRGEVEDLRTALGTVRTNLDQVRGRVDALSAQQSAAPQGGGQQTPAPQAGLPAPAAPGDEQTPSAPAAPAQQAAPGVSPQELDQRLAALDTRITEATQGATQATEDLGKRLDEVASSRAQASAVLSLTERVAQVETLARQAASRQDKALALLLAIGQLREAVDAGRPYLDELKTVRALAPEDLDIEKRLNAIAGHADKGIPGLVQLRLRLDALAPEIIRAEATPEDSAGWWNRTVDRLFSVVSVRRTDGDAVGDGTAAVVSRAEANLDGGQLPLAFTELQKLKGAPADTAAPWMADALARLNASGVLSSLTGDALARLAAEDAVPSQEPPQPSNRAPGVPNTAPNGNAGTQPGREG